MTKPDPSISRRRFLSGTGKVLAAGTFAAGALDTTASADPMPSQRAALRALGRESLRLPGSRVRPDLPIGTDLLPGVDHIVVLMLENHSFDNLFGMLGRGDGFRLNRHGRPTATNPYSDGRIQHAFRMPTTCQLPGRPSQSWTASHNSFNNGENDGFVSTVIGVGTSQIVGGVAMGYWTGDDLPFTYSLARSFPIADRWFSSLLGQTHANRRYLIGATSVGLTRTVNPTTPAGAAALTSPVPAAGTIFNQLDLHGISWANYAALLPFGATPLLYPVNNQTTEAAHAKPFAQFFTDAAAGALPAFTLLDPEYNTQSQENPENIVVGEAMLAQVVAALGASPQWPRTLFVLMYDEHGGYYDHVVPPPALPPDAIPPSLQPGEVAYDGFARYGFRVPAVVVSPFAKRHHVSHHVYDHTSVLAMLERKWNLPALTFRDANAHDLTDFLDLDALADDRPTFPTLPRLAAPGNTPAALACSVTGPGTIPPPGSISDER
ncbi:MAG TPA: alkaline phosphatase family protein [Pseudonocardiaceae bacterium]